MNVNDIVKLIDKLNETSINDLKVTQDNFQLHISKNYIDTNSSTNIIPTTVPATTSVVNSSSAATSTSSISTDESINHEMIDPSDIIVKSPLVGIYYESSSPDGGPLVSVGQKVKKGDVLCIIEAMKIFNEIKSPSNGVIKKIFASNLEVIEYDQELIVIGDE